MGWWRVGGKALIQFIVKVNGNGVEWLGGLGIDYCGL